MIAIIYKNGEIISKIDDFSEGDKIKTSAIYEDEGQLKGKQRADKGQLKDTNDEPIPTLVADKGQTKGNQRATKGQTKGNPIIKSKKETKINKDMTK
jgi:hypothetical protein